MKEEESFEDYLKKQIEDGYISEDGTPLKCECGCVNFKEVNQNWEGYPLLFPAGAVEVVGGNIEDALVRADNAMYIAKAESKAIKRNVINVAETPTATTRT